MKKVAPVHQFKPQSDKLYLAFFKPYGVHSQFTRELEEHTTLADFNFPKNVYSVGRLDADSEGLLILSDDSRLNNALLDPVRGHSRTYLVQVENVPNAASLGRLERGPVVQGRQTLPCRAKLLDGEPELPPRPVPVRFRKNVPTAWLMLTLTEGKNRQVRRMTAAVGYPTLRLVRWAIGDLTLDKLGLNPGQWKALDHSQVALLFQSLSN